MRKILWAVLFFAAYIYVTTSNQESYFLEKGKAVYEYLSAWFEDAELDFHLKKESEKNIKRRWR